MFERHPKLKLVCVEADAGWVPHYMYRMDHAYDRHRYWLPAGTLSKMPSEYFRENVYTTFQDDWVAFQMKDMCNIRRLMWANDFPHSDSTWPWSQDVLAKHTANLTEDEKNYILHDNVAELYHLSIPWIASDAWYPPKVMEERHRVMTPIRDSSSEPVAPDGKGTRRCRPPGELVTETFAYDGGRQVTVYLPPDPPEAVVFAGDGQLISQWGDFVAAAGAPSTMIVGVHRLADETLRLHEYSPGFDPERFAAHERFFVEDVRAWAQSRFGVALPKERTAVFGVSAGGELALAIGLRHPDVYGAVFCASPGGGYRPPGVMPSPLPRAYLVGGTRGALVSRERDPVGGRAARRRGGCRDDRTGRLARRRVLARRAPAHGGLGVRTMKHCVCATSTGCVRRNSTQDSYVSINPLALARFGRLRLQHSCLATCDASALVPL